MAVRKTKSFSAVLQGVKKGTSIGNRPKRMKTMNKSKKRSYKLYRGQGK
jgi:hypothetical protein